jgi:Suppressor of fused protein (SUFU)
MEEMRLAEVVAILPKGWPLSKADWQDERNYWPIRLLKTLARYPHERGTWLGYGHSLANGESEADTKPYAEGTALCATVLLPPMSLGEAAWSFKRADGKPVYFWAVVPLYLSEMKYKIEQGADALMDLFDRHGVTDRIDPLRPSVVA